MVDKEFRFTKADAFDKFGMWKQFSIDHIKQNPLKWDIYLNILAQVMDNDLPYDNIGNEQIRPLQAFRFNNVSKMALVTQNTMPGTWFGVQAVSYLYYNLNKLFRPLCDDFQICVLGGGFVYSKKIAKKMRKKISIQI